MPLETFTTGLDGLDYGDEKYKAHEPDFEEKQPPPDYSQKIPIGEDVRSGRTVWMRLSRSDRVGIFGRTGSGKTTLAKNLLSRFYQGGHKLLYPNDVKNDFQDIGYEGGASDKLIDDHKAGLYEGEEPKAMTKEMYSMPFLLEHYIRGTPDYITPFTYGLSHVSEGELLDLLQLSSNKQKNILREIWNTEDEIKFQVLADRLQGEEFEPNAAGAVYEALKSLKNQKVLTDYKKYDKDPLRHLERTHQAKKEFEEGEEIPEDEKVPAVVIAYKKWQRFKRQGSEKLELYISIILRRLMEKIEMGEINGSVVVFIDEAHTFCGTEGTQISRGDIIDLVDLGRAYNIPMLFSTQRPSQLPKEEIVEQMSHVFLSKTVPTSDFIEILKMANIIRHEDYSNDRWTEILSNMSKYQKIYIDIERSTYRIIDPYAPLVAHRDSA